MATESFKAKMADLTREEVVDECYEAVRQLRQLKRELADERNEVERLKTVVQGLEAHNRSFSMEIAYLTSRPVLCSMNTASGQDEDKEVADVAAVRQVHVQCHRLQGLVRKRWLDDALGHLYGRNHLSPNGMKEAASKWVVEAANATADDWAADDLSTCTFQYLAKDRMFLIFCTDAMGTKKVYPWHFDFSLLYGC